MQDVWSKFARWVIFTVVLSLIPLALDFVFKASGGTWPSVDEVMSHGELALVCTALAGVGLGELIGLSDKAKTAKIVLGGVCFISAILSIALYIAMRATTGPLGSSFLDNLSWWLFAETVLSGSIAILVSEAQK